MLTRKLEEIGIFRIECWLQNSGIPYNVEPRIEKCVMHETGHCRGDFTIEREGDTPPG